MKLHIPQLGKSGWKRALSRNGYAMVSAFLLAAYVAAFAAGILFLTREIRTAFTVNEQLAGQQVTTLDLASYENVAKRFNLGR